MFDFSTAANVPRLQEFAAILEEMQEKIGFRVSARGWCYLLEQNGAIDKSQFNKVESWVNNCRRRGILPIDFVAEEDARKFYGVETPCEESPVQDMGGWLEAFQNCEEHYAVDWWNDEEYYIQMVVEKVDLVTLFRPVCRHYHIPIANSKGWSSLLQRAEYARRYQEAEERGMTCVLLYCGDHDPDGLRISDFMRKNLEQVKNIRWKDGTEGYDPAKLEVARFGLNYQFIVDNGFTWIDNLITGSGRDLGSPSHPNHDLDYVQDYIGDFGRRKCEANVLVTDPSVARSLCRGAIEEYLGGKARQRFADKRQRVRDYVTKFRERSGIADAIKEAWEAIGDEDYHMNDETWL